MFLSATTQSLEIDLNGAVAANQLPVVVSYVDVNQSTFAMSAMTTATTQTNSTTAVTIVAAPGATTTRQIKSLSIKNSDTSPVLLWVQVNDNGTLREVTKCTLAVNDSLIYTDTEGWKTLDANGAAKYSQSGVAVASGKTLTVSNTLTLAGTDGTTVTFPSTSATVARTDAGQTFTGTNTFGALTLTGNVGVTGTPSFTLTGCSFTAGALVGTSLSTGSGAISGGAISGTTLALSGRFTSTPNSTANLGVVADMFQVVGLSGAPAVGKYTQMGLGQGWNTYAPVVLATVSTNVTNYGTEDFIIATRSATTDTAPTERFRITSAGAVTIPGTLALTATATPTGTGAGAVGQIAWDTNYLYICTATNDWRRVALADF